MRVWYVCVICVCDMQALRDQRHADAEAKKPSKGKKKGKDKAKQKETKQLSTADAATAWRHNQLTAAKGQKRYNDSLPNDCMH